MLECAQRTGRSTSTASDFVVAALAGDAPVILDDHADKALHAAFHHLRVQERVSWPCPCRFCKRGRARLRPRPVRQAA